MIKTLVFFLSCSLFFSYCTQLTREDKLQRKIFYRKKLKQIAKTHFNKYGDKNPTFNYHPAFIQKTKKEDIIIDKETKMKYVRNEIIIELEQNKTDIHLLSELEQKKIRAKLVGYIPTFNLVQLKIKLTPSVIKNLRSLPSVLNVYRNYIKETNNTNISLSRNKKKYWHLYNYDIPQIWKQFKGKGITIAILDSGMDLKLKAFEKRIIYPYSTITQSENFEDGVYTKKGNKIRVIAHGTHVASIAAAGKDKNGNFIGIAPEANIMPIQILGFSITDEKIFTNDLMIIEGIARAIEFKADIINLSIGSDFSHVLTPGIEKDIKAYKKAFGELYQYRITSNQLFQKIFSKCFQQNVSIVISAGNEGINSEIQPLINFEYNFSIGAINKNNSRASFSNFNVSSYAPGEDIYTLSVNNNYFNVSGTSFSAPYVSGLIALINPKKVKKNLNKVSKNNANSFHFTVQNAIKESNKNLRSSILPEAKEINVFSPIHFFNKLTGLSKLKVIKTDRNINSLDEFSKLYEHLFIYKKDPEELQLDKILIYFNLKNEINSSDPEVVYAKKNLFKNFDYFISTLQFSYGYYTAEMLTYVNLTPSQLNKIIKYVPQSDYAAIVFRSNNYKKALEQLYYRIKNNPREFNWNTIVTIDDLEEKFETKLEKILTFAQANTKESFKIHEVMSCYILSSYLPQIKNEKTIKEITQIILKTYDKFLKQVYTYDQIRYAKQIFYSLLSIKSIQSIKLMINILEKIEKIRSKENKELYLKKLVKSSYYDELYQELLNTNTNFGFKYDHLATKSEKQQVLIQFKEAIKKAEYKNSVFK